MSKQDAKQLRAIKQYGMSESDASLLERIASQLDSDAKRYEDSCKLQDIGKSAMDSIAEMVAALDCDYDRLEELKEMKRGYEDSETEPHFVPWSEAEPDNAEELADLIAAAGECSDREQAEQFIHEDALSVQMRSDWETAEVWQGRDSGHGTGGIQAVEFEILLSTGGPATRIIGDLENGEPTRARLQAQDWFQPWTDYVQADQDTLLSYCRCFYFGEG